MEKVVMTFNIPQRTRNMLEFIKGYAGLDYTATVIVAVEKFYEKFNVRAEEANMSIKGLYLDEDKLEKVNASLNDAGYASYPGDRTTEQQSGCGTGYVCNLIDAIAGADPDARREVEGIVRENV